MIRGSRSIEKRLAKKKHVNKKLCLVFAEMSNPFVDHLAETIENLGLFSDCFVSVKYLVQKGLREDKKQSTFFLMVE